MYTALQWHPISKHRFGTKSPFHNNLDFIVGCLPSFHAMLLFEKNFSSVHALEKEIGPI